MESTRPINSLRVIAGGLNEGDERSTETRPIEKGPLSNKYQHVYSEILNNINEMSYGIGDQSMDEGFKKLIDRLDQDMRDHKQEMRDRDARLHNEMMEREERTSKMVENLLNAQNQLLDTKLSHLDTKISHLDQSVASNLEQMKTELQTITERVDSIHSRVDSAQ